MIVDDIQFLIYKKMCLVQNRVNGLNGQITAHLVRQIVKRASELVEEKIMKMKESFKNLRLKYIIWVML